METEQLLEPLVEKEFLVLESNHFNTWAKAKHVSKIKSNLHNKPIFCSHSQDELKGKVVQLSQNIQSVVLMYKILIKKLVEKDGWESYEEHEEFKFFDERIDNRSSRPVESMALDFWEYRLINKGKEYIVLSQQELGSEEYSFKGMIVKMSDSSEISKTLKFKKITPVFIVTHVEPSVKSLAPKELIQHSKNMGWSIQEWRDFIFTHPNGNVYNHVEAYESLRSAQLLSGLCDGYPLHMLTVGPAGTGKTYEAESLDFKFQESSKIFEAGNSTIKGLIPSFKEKPASPGYLLRCNRLAITDELFKMIDQASFSSEQTLRQNLGQLNMLLEHKKRMIGSGNDNSFVAQATCKCVFQTNPLSNKQNLADHLRVIDPTLLSRLLIWVQDQEHRELVFKRHSKPVQITSKYIDKYAVSDKDSVQITLKEVYDKNNNNKILYIYPIGVLYKYIDAVRSDFLTIFDSCKAFLSEYDPNKAKEIYSNSLTWIENTNLKEVWKARGLHHITLILDGVIKERCLFKDYDDSFTAREEDYEITRALVNRILETWKTPFIQEYTGRGKL